VLGVLDSEDVEADVAITFVGKQRMRRLNAEYLGRDRSTDVIAFALPQPGGALAGDVYICPYAAARQARAHDVTLPEELLRLVVHGTLHVLGWDHPEGASRMASAMWRRQERYVAALA
jgi:probable rRNA maturation factor